MNYLILLLLLGYANTFFYLNVPNVHEPKPVTARLLVSTDEGRSWSNIGKDLPDDLRLSTIIPFRTSFYLGTQKGIYKSNFLFPKAYWENTQESETQIMNAYTFNNNLYMTTIWNGLNIFSPISGKLVKMKENAPIETVSSVVSVSNSQMFYCSDYGIFKSTDSGKSWTKRYNKSRIWTMAKSKDNILAGGTNGVWISDLKGEQWSQTLVTEGMVSWMFEAEDEVLAIAANESQFLNLPNAIWVSRNHGKSWKQVNLDAPMKKIYQIIKTKTYYFVSCNDGIYRAKDLSSKWEKVHSLSPPDNGFYTLLPYDHYLFCILKDLGC